MNKRVSCYSYVDDNAGGCAYVIGANQEYDLTPAELATIRANGVVIVDGDTLVDFNVDLAGDDTDEFDDWRKTL